jgi:hypothetical protein
MELWVRIRCVLCRNVCVNSWTIAVDPFLRELTRRGDFRVVILAGLRIGNVLIVIRRPFLLTFSIPILKLGQFSSWMYSEPFQAILGFSKEICIKSTENWATWVKKEHIFQIIHISCQNGRIWSRIDKKDADPTGSGSATLPQWDTYIFVTADSVVDFLHWIEFYYRSHEIKDET